MTPRTSGQHAQLVRKAAQIAGSWERGAHERANQAWRAIGAERRAALGTELRRLGRGAMVEALNASTAARAPNTRAKTGARHASEPGDAFTHETAALAEEAIARAGETDAKRGDFTAIDFAVIDPDGARDHDDAIWCTRTPQGWRLIVAIADVGAIVRAGSALDRIIAKRANSIYLPENTVAMCPEILSESTCSLNGDGAKRAIVTALDVDREGKTRCTAAMRPAWVRTRRPITYRDAESAARTGTPLGALAECAHALRERRRAQAAVLIETSTEVPITRGDHGRPSLEPARQRREPERWIEEAMIAANEANAQWLAANDASGAVYRTHAAPDDTSLALETARETGLVVRDDAHWLAHLGEDNAGKRAWAEQLVRQAMTKASYASAPDEHFGLASACYAHTTSPIRRYADLRCQQSAHALHRTPGTETPERAAQTLLGALDTAESGAVRRERDAARRWGARAIEHARPPLPWEQGVILGVTDFGLFCECPSAPGMGALVHIRTLGPDWWTRTGLATLEGERTGRRYRGGDTVEMRITHASPALGRIDAQIRSARERGHR